MDGEVHRKRAHRKRTELALRRFAPNPRDSRHRESIRRGLAFADKYLSESERMFSHRQLTKHLGNQSKPMGAWLRRMLLIRRGSYQMGKHSFRYIRNKPGYMTLVRTFEETYGEPYRLSEDSFREELAALPADMQFEYSEKSHRLYHPLQYLRREAKAMFWTAAGLPFDYDIEACAPTIFFQLAERAGLPWVMSDAVGDYIADKDGYRRHVADLVGVSLTDAKRLLNALFNGARISKSSHCAIYQVLDCDGDRTDALASDEMVLGLRRQIRYGWRWIGRCSGRKLRTSREKWGVYFLHERQALDAVRDYLASRGIRHFAEHDGWRTDRELDVRDLEGHIERATGFKLKIQDKNRSVIEY